MAKYWGQQASGLLIYNSKGQILLLQRSHEVMGGHGEFAIPGGRVDIGDTPQSSARKEGNEEMGGVPKGKFTGSYVFKKPLNIGDIIYLSGESEYDSRKKLSPSLVRILSIILSTILPTKTTGSPRDSIGRMMIMNGWMLKTLLMTVEFSHLFET